MTGLDYLAVFVSALSGFVVTLLWYGPLFGRLWTRINGLSEEEIREVLKQKQLDNLNLS